MVASPGLRADVPAHGGGLAVVTSRVQPHLDALQEFFAAETGAFEPELRELVGYCLGHSGKRIRPVLVFLAGATPGEDAHPDLVKAAAVVELVHVATLVHDDILDDASLRHNAATVSVKHGADVAVLLGDALFSHALCLAASFPTTEVCRAVAEATRRVCAGEIGQTFFKGRPEIQMADYFRIIDLKTAELFRVSCHLGALLGGHGEGFATAAATFGRQLGIAYQIFDDLADYVGREDRIGKTLGTDLASGKFTLPLMLLLERLDESERRDLVGRIRDGAGETIGDLSDRLREVGVDSAVRERFEQELALGEAALQPYADLPPAAGLLACSAFVRSQMDRLG